MKRFLLFVCGLVFSAQVLAEPLPAALSPYAGKVIYVDFWASWCAPCAESFPWLNTLQAKFGPRFVVVGVGVDERDKDAERFLKRHPAQFAIVRDPKGELAQHFDIGGMPSAVLIAADGSIAHRHDGFHATDTADYEAAISKALARP